MFDRAQYEENLKKVREEQVEQLYAVVSDYIKLNSRIGDLPLISKPSPEAMQKIIDIPIQATGRDSREVIQELADSLKETCMLLQHPKFCSFVTSSVSPYALAGAIIGDVFNLNACGFEISPTAALIEEKLIRWMGSLAGFDENCGGLFTSGGSLSNLTGCIAARKNRLAEDEYPIGCAYLSDQAHSSVKKGLSLMGLRKDQIRILPSDDDYRLQPAALEQAIQEDLAKGRKPFLVIATIGTTNTGSIDPLEEIGAIRDKYGLWMHIDGAFGGSILFSSIYRNLAKGVEKADSLSWDTHKWAMQGYSSSCIIAKRKTDLINTYAEHPEYLADIIDAEHTDGWDLGIEMSRPARALKLWCTVQGMGTDLLSDVIDYAFFNANVAKRELLRYPDWELTSKPMCGTLTFRYVPKDVPAERYDALNAAISQRIIEGHYAYVVTTILKGRRVLRLNLINGNTTDKDVIEIADRLNEIAQSLHPEFAEG